MDSKDNSISDVPVYEAEPRYPPLTCGDLDPYQDYHEEPCSDCLNGKISVCPDCGGCDRCGHDDDCWIGGEPEVLL